MHNKRKITAQELEKIEDQYRIMIIEDLEKRMALQMKKDKEEDIRRRGMRIMADLRK